MTLSNNVVVSTPLNTGPLYGPKYVKEFCAALSAGNGLLEPSTGPANIWACTAPFVIKMTKIKEIQCLLKYNGIRITILFLIKKIYTHPILTFFCPLGHPRKRGFLADAAKAYNSPAMVKSVQSSTISETTWSRSLLVSPRLKSL